MSSCRKRRTSINLTRAFLICSKSENATLTAASGFDCTFSVSNFHFRFGTSLSRGGSAALSWYPLHRLLFICHLRSDTAQPSCLHHPVIHLLALHHIWPTTSRLQAHCAPLFVSTSISPSATSAASFANLLYQAFLVSVQSTPFETSSRSTLSFSIFSNPKRPTVGLVLA